MGLKKNYSRVSRAISPNEVPIGMSKREFHRRENPNWALEEDGETLRSLPSGKAKALFKVATGQVDSLEAELDPITQLKHDIRMAEQIYNDRIQASSLFEKNVEARKERERIRQEHDAYADQMTSAIVKAITSKKDQNGNDKTKLDKIIETASMSAALLVLSPMFRNKLIGRDIHAYDRYNDTLREKVRDQVAKKDAKGKAYGKRLQKKLDYLDTLDRDGHAPYSEYSAAITMLAIDQKAAADMRKPGADVDAIQKARALHIDGLMKMASQDGVNPKDIEDKSRELIGKHINRNPEFGATYNELAFGSYRPTEPVRQVVNKPNGGRDVKLVWDGGFKHVNGSKLTSGTFNVRELMSEGDHLDLMTDSFALDLAKAKTPEEFQKRTFDMAASRHDKFEESAGYDDAGKQKRGDVKRMLKAMEEDGFDATKQNEIFVASASAALVKVAEAHPEIAGKWMDTYGKTWGKTFDDMIADPTDKAGRWGNIDKVKAEHGVLKNSSKTSRVEKTEVIPVSETERTAPVPVSNKSAETEVIPTRESNGQKPIPVPEVMRESTTAPIPVRKPLNEAERGGRTRPVKSRFTEPEFTQSNPLSKSDKGTQRVVADQSGRVERREPKQPVVGHEARPIPVRGEKFRKSVPQAVMGKDGLPITVGDRASVEREGVDVSSSQTGGTNSNRVASKSAKAAQNARESSILDQLSKAESELKTPSLTSGMEETLQKDSTHSKNAKAKSRTVNRVAQINASKNAKHDEHKNKAKENETQVIKVNDHGLEVE